MRGFMVILALAAWSAPAFAGKKCESADARKAVVDGKTHYDFGRYQEAIELWERAYAECPSTGLLFNLAQAHRMLGNNEEAITLYRSWLREAPDIDPEVRREVEARVSELAALIAAQRKAAERPPTGVSGEGAGGRTETEPATTEPAVTEPPPAVEPSQPLPPPPSDPSPPAWYKDRWGLVLTAAGVATLGVGAGLFIHGGSLADDAANAMDEAEVQRMIDSAGTYRTVGSVFLVVGGAVAVTGIVKLVIPDRPKRRAADVAVGPGWIVVSGEF